MCFRQIRQDFIGHRNLLTKCHSMIDICTIVRTERETLLYNAGKIKSVFPWSVKLVSLSVTTASIDRNKLITVSCLYLWIDIRTR